MRRRLLDLAAQVAGADSDEDALQMMRDATGLTMTDPDADRAELDRRRAAAGDGRPVVMRVVGLASGRPTLLAGQWVVDYDPTVPGLRCTCRRDEARRFATAGDAHAYWTAESGLPYPRNRPLTAYTIVVEPADEPDPEPGPADRAARNVRAAQPAHSSPGRPSARNGVPPTTGGW